jgi:hypothetical protein
MSTPTVDDTFVLRTHLALLDLKAEADQVRRGMGTADHACRGCRDCQALSVIHLRIDDHLTQLDEYAAEHRI